MLMERIHGCFALTAPCETGQKNAGGGVHFGKASLPKIHNVVVTSKRANKPPSPSLSLSLSLSSYMASQKCRCFTIFSLQLVPLMSNTKAPFGDGDHLRGLHNNKQASLSLSFFLSLSLSFLVLSLSLSLILVLLKSFESLLVLRSKSRSEVRLSLAVFSQLLCLCCFKVRIRH